MQNKIGNNLEGIVKQISCPQKALQLRDGICFCVATFNIGKKDISGMNLGSFPKDITDHCGKCKEYLKTNVPYSKKDLKVAFLPIDKTEDKLEVICPLTKSGVYPIDTCKFCQYLAKDVIKKRMKGYDDEPDSIPCSYPTPNPSSMDVFFKLSKDEITSGKKEIKKLLKDIEKDKVIQPKVSSLAREVETE